MFKKIGTFYKNNRVYSILMLISIICIISIMVGVILYFLGQTNKDKYGNRLDGIENIEFKEEHINTIEDSFLTNESVDSIDIIVKGKLIYVNIVLKTGNHSDAEALVNNSLELFSDDVKGFYDIQFVVENSDKEIKDNYPIMGYLKAGKSVVAWTNYTVDE